MPVSKHRRRSETRVRKPDPAPTAPRPNVTTADELRQAIANPALDFPAKVVVAGTWWFQQLLGKVGDTWQGDKTSRKDKKTAALLLCVAMDGEQGQNDDLSPMVAAMLRPYCPAPTFVDAWEKAKQMPPGTVRMRVAKFLDRSNRPAA
ncbi:MAG TPA: hypothetical protein DDZ81_25255 [Acetobacteraceae bacterium]|jgi:hypothetical protein|nr:hypothetical protein [Acetobacteraceae bacterium]